MAKWPTDAKRDAFLQMWDAARRIVADGAWHYDDRIRKNVKTYDGRPWFARETTKYRLHPAIDDAIYYWESRNWQELLLEWPHVSETDANRLAYTRDERSGVDNRQVVTTIGKYLTRHFPDMPDHVVRDYVARFTYDGDISITTNLDEMVNAVIEGPSSCMSRNFDIRCDDGHRRHPYAV